MQASVIVFPGSNRERDIARALKHASGITPHLVWHGDSSLPKSDLIVLPGGFSYGDYLRSGAIAAHSPIMRAVKEEAKRGVAVLGVCNGFQTLVESGLLPGALMRNAALKFQCRIVPLKVEATDTIFTKGYTAGQVIRIPIAHADGNYSADSETVQRLEGEGRIAFRYCAETNGSIADIAGVYDKARRVMGMMPHFEDAVEATHGNTDGAALFTSLAQSLAA